MNKITINDHIFQLSDKEIKVNLLTLLRSVGIKITGFCYHYLLPVAGNCRVCLVQVASIGKPIASCAYPTMKDMNIITDSNMVLAARESAITLLLLNHPLDCPTCDQAGSCDLQEITYAYGKDRGSFTSHKRSVDNFYSNSYIKPFMNRCIHCTRCIRFSQLVNGLPYYGITGRGMYSTVGTYVTSLFNTNYASSVIDLCPVGALTDASKSYVYRLWEVQSRFFPDFTNFEAHLLSYSFLGSKLVSVTPVDNHVILSNTSRYFPLVYFNAERLQSPLLNQLPICSNTAFDFLLQSILKYSHVNIITDHIHLHLLSQFFPVLPSSLFNKANYSNNVIYHSNLNIDWSTIRHLYILESLDLFLIVPNLALQLQSACINSTLQIFYINPNSNIKLLTGSRIINEDVEYLPDSIVFTNNFHNPSNTPVYFLTQSPAHYFAKIDNVTHSFNFLNINFNFYTHFPSLPSYNPQFCDIAFSSIINDQIKHTQLVLPSSTIFDHPLNSSPSLSSGSTAYLSFLFYCIHKFHKSFSITIKNSIFSLHHF